MRFLLLLFIRCYKYLLSPWLGTNCRFTPSCSDYAMEAVHTHGALQGTALAAKRILRCNPWGGSGYDPLPLSATHPNHRGHDA